MLVSVIEGPENLTFKSINKEVEYKKPTGETTNKIVK